MKRPISDDNTGPRTSSSSLAEPSAASGSMKKRKNDDDDVIATASVYKENDSNFLNYLTKEQGINYKMKRARG